MLSSVSRRGDSMSITITSGRSVRTCCQKIGQNRRGAAGSIRRADVEHVVAVEEPARLLIMATADLGGDLRDHRLGVFAELEHVDLAVPIAAHLQVGGPGQSLEQG